MHNSINKTRVVNVFNEAMDSVRIGKKPSISKIMLNRGYSKSSARSLKVTQTKTWAQLLNEIDDNMLKARLIELAGDKKDKRASLTAIDMLLKLKDRYPAQKQQWQGQLEALSRYKDDTPESNGAVDRSERSEVE